MKAQRTRTESKQRREVEGWKASGQSGKAYAKARGYSPASLTNWAAKIRESAKDAGPRIVRLEVAGRGEIAVEVGAARVVVTRGFDAALLREVIDALGATAK